ncbi:IclR family transcriptional regulator [Heyndrickxia sporothermodurans]|uniref:IclR family transcriptional regulator n=1 Tax=Heyndrickxia sporothermodurans TaxID=46224 RepID=UPI000D39F327|nr:IclR family transcriptional regulator [Heyndrickxia sporothermodurans]PTY94769.1 IclR family transcriptional regulator [Heyndrickxia sporothermodurans]
MNQSVIKALGMLDLFTEEEPELSLKEVTERVQLPKPTVYRLLTSLEYCGFLTKTMDSEYDKRYKLGLKLMELGQLVSEQLELRKVALPYMKKLANEINEVVHLVIVNHDEAVYIEKVESTHAVRLYTRIGKRSPLYLGSGPKLLLAFLPDKKRKEILDAAAIRPLNKNQIINEIEEIKRNEFAISYGEQDEGTTGISFPIYDYHRKVIAALAVSGPSYRFEGAHLEMIKEKTKKSAKDISSEMGYR